MNFQLYNDKVWTFSIKPQNAAGVAQPWPANSSPQAVSSNPASLVAGVQLGSNNTFTLVLTPKVQVSPGLTVTVTNSGMAPLVFVVDIVADPDLLTVAADTVAADITTTPQNIPVAPGP
jgi:hypothetical protein